MDWLSNAISAIASLFSSPGADAAGYGAGYGDIGAGYAGLGADAASTASTGASSFGWAPALSALGTLGTLGSAAGSIYAASNMPQQSGQPNMTAGYPADMMSASSGWGARNEAINPALRQKKRFAGGRADLQSQMGSATISPQLAELMLGEDYNPLASVGGRM